MNQPTEQFTIGTLAREAGVTVETIRFYQRQGLLRETARVDGGFRRYDRTDVARVRFIKASQRLGFTLGDVGQLLQLDEGAQCEQARAIAVDKLTEVRQRLAELHRIEAALTQLVGRCDSTRGMVRCPLIAHLQEQA